MLPNERISGVSKGQMWTGWILSGLMTAFLLFDGVMKVMQIQPVVESFAKLGFPPGVALPIGVVLIACVLLYALPRTAILGAMLLTGYLGGAVATHVHAGDPLSHVLGPVLFGVLVWGGLYLREPRLRALVPLRS
jgi:hypothetical protein